jgi:chromosome segregation ATPase
MSIRAWVVAGVAVLAAACASSGVDRTDSLMKSLDGLANASSTARADVEKVTATLKGFSEAAATDPRGALRQYQAEVGKVAGSRASVASAGTSVRKSMDAHFAAWEKDANAMTNSDIREASMKRRDEARETMSALEPKIAEAGKMFDSYISNLRDIEKLLGTDLSSGGIESASSAMSKATDQAEDVTEALQKVEESANELRSKLGVPASPQPGEPAKEPAK